MMEGLLWDLFFPVHLAGVTLFEIVTHPISSSHPADDLELL